MGKKNRNREANWSQHYVPRCYLNNFADSAKRLYIYDKSISKAIYKSTKDVGCSPEFYRISEKFINGIDEKIDKDFLETEFFAADVESQFGPLLKSLNARCQQWLKTGNIAAVITAEEKVELARQIAIQYLRLPRIRKKYFNATKKFDQKSFEIVKSFTSNQYPDEKEFIDRMALEHDEDFASVIHGFLYTNFFGIQNYLSDNNTIWVFNATTTNVVTSDNPILIKPHLENQMPALEGFAMKGAEIIFPLNPSLVLTIYDKEYFSEKAHLDNSFIQAGMKSTWHFNYYQYMLATKQVFSVSNDLSFIDALRMVNGGGEIFADKNEIKVY